MSALIGTVIVLAITIAGIATALFMGAPVLVRMQERAALENVVGQLEEVRAAGNDMFVPDEARYPTISIPAGRLTLEPGTHVLVTSDRDIAGTSYDSCDLRVTDWEDFTTATANAKVTVTATGCPTLANMSNSTTGTPCNGAAVLPTTGACFEAYRVNGTQPASWPVCTPTTVASCYLTWTVAGSEYTLSVPLEDDADYLFRITNSTTTVYAEAWLLHMDRLIWTSGGVDAAYEGGAVYAQEGEGFFLSSAPAVSESPLFDPYFLRFTTLQGSSQGEVSGSTSHSVGLVLQGGHVRVDYAAVRLLRLDFTGRFAEAWCNAFLLRDTLASLDGDFYRQDDADPGHLCSPDSPDPDGVRSVKYIEDDPSTGAYDPQPFTFTLTQSILHGSLIL